MDFWINHSIIIGEKKETAIQNKNNIYQDGTTPMYRDVDGKLWAMSGHSHVGEIAMFSGTCLDDMQKQYAINTNFCVGHADYAFNGIRYPEGVKARGSIWPFGLYICPKTHRFFCFFHNETGWNGKGTGYDSKGLCQTPAFDSDFRHVGLMHSDDEGRNWTFDRWVLTAEQVCFTELFNPGVGNVTGQKAGRIALGSGDFSIFIEPQGEYIYLFYNIIRVNMDTASWESCDVYLARTRKRDDGIMGDFVKFYDGQFCEAGNFGKETKLIDNAWHPRVMWSEKFGKYFISYSCVQPTGNMKSVVQDIMEVRVSDDMIHWSEPVRLMDGEKEFGNHYVAMVADDKVNQPNIVVGDTFSILSNHNGTDVARHMARFAEK